MSQFLNRMGKVAKKKKSDKTEMSYCLAGDPTEEDVIACRRLIKKCGQWHFHKVKQTYISDFRDQVRTVSHISNCIRCYQRIRKDIGKSWIPFTGKQLANIVLDKVRTTPDLANKLIRVELEAYINPAFARFKPGDGILLPSTCTYVRTICRGVLFGDPAKNVMKFKALETVLNRQGHKARLVINSTQIVYQAPLLTSNSDWKPLIQPL